MLAAPSPTYTPKDVIRLLARHRRQLMICTLLGGALAIAYVFVRTQRWEASQALIVRNEAYNNLEGAGKFRHPDDMKVTLETLLELAKSQGVLQRALRAVGPPGGKVSSKWPSQSDIVRLRKRIKLAPPKGAEFGKTEIFYLTVMDEDRRRAIELATTICDALQSRFQEVLNEKAESMVSELVNSAALAQKQVDEASARLAEMERQVGADLAELRILHASPSASSDLRQKVVFIEGEIRKLDTQKRTNEELLKLLQAALDDPTHLIAAPNSLLESQPALKRLKEGLIDAQIKTAQLQGNMTREHPLVIAAMTAEQEIRRDIHNELSVAIRGVEADSRLLDGQLQLLQTQLGEANARLARIAQLRTQYSNRVAEVEHATKVLQLAQSNLAEARAKQIGALNSSLISRVDLPTTGTRPAGPTAAMIVLYGLLAGLLAGLGLVALTAPPLRFNRRKTDQVAEANGAARTSPTTVETRPPPQQREPVSKRRTARPTEKLSLKQALARLTEPSDATL